MAGKGLMKKQVFSDELAEVTGKNKGSRAEATKWLWAYIKANDLQDPKDKRTIVCDGPMQALTGTKKINMLKIGSMLNDHLSDE